MWLVALKVLGATWKYIAVALLIAALYFAAVHWLHSYADARAAPKIAAAQAEASEARAALSTYQAEQRAKAATLVLEWGAVRDRAEQAEKDLANERAKQFEGLQGRARAGTGSSANIALPPSLVSVLDESVAAANSSQVAGPTAQPSESAAPVTADTAPTYADLSAAKVQCDAAYADAVGEIVGIHNFYHDLQSKEQ